MDNRKIKVIGFLLIIFCLPFTLLGCTNNNLPIEKIVENHFNKVVIIKSNKNAATSVASGIVVSADGYILTNSHVISSVILGEIFIHKDIDVYFNKTDNPIKAELINYDLDLDMAILKINKTKLDYFKIEKNDVKIGNDAVLISNSGGVGKSVSKGIVSALNVKINEKTYIQTDASTNPGSSGGAMIVNNKFAGLLTMKFDTKKNVYEGISFVVPVDVCKTYLQRNNL